MLMGTCEHRLDSKGRLVLPAKFRSELGSTVVCTVGLDRCVAVYSTDGWEKYLAKLQTLPFAKESARRFMRVVLGSADELPVDGAGRILVGAFLKDYAGLGEQVTIVGVSDHVELWNSERWNAGRDDILKDFESLAEGVGDLGV